MWQLAAICILAATAQAQESPRDIILRSALRDAEDQARRRNYTYLQAVEEKNLDPRGAVISTRRETFDITSLFGRPYRRLIERDGKPLPAADQQKEEARMEKEMRKRQGESERDRRKRQEAERKGLEEEKEFRREIADAFVFRMLPQESVSGLPVHVLEAEPRPGYRPRTREGRVLSKVRGKLWVSKADLRWVKLEVEFIDTFSLGWFLFRVDRGTRMRFESARVGDEVWMPARAWVRGQVRVAGLKRFHREMNVSWSQFRRFATDSRIVSGAVQ